MGFGVQSQIGHQTTGISFSISQHIPTMHHHKDVQDILDSYSRYCQQEFPLLLEMGMSFQMLLDNLLEVLNPLFQERDDFRQVIKYCFMPIHMILSRMGSILLLTQHLLQVVQSVKKVVQLLHFRWQRLPGEWVIHEAEMSQIPGILWICLSASTNRFSPSLGIHWIGQTHPPSLLVDEVSQRLLISTRRFHYQMDYGSVNVLSLFLYPSSYSLESLVVIGKASYEDRFILILIPVCYIHSFLTNVNANTQCLHNAISLGSAWGYLTTWYAGSSRCCMSLNSLRLPRQTDLSTHEFVTLGALSTAYWRSYLKKGVGIIHISVSIATDARQLCIF
jgi:hypothetical protein